MIEVTKLKHELIHKERKLHDYTNWLKEHVTHPEAPKIIKMRNEVSVEIYTLKTKIENLQKHRPLLGDEIGGYQKNPLLDQLKKQIKI